jgi:hypothetical protein
MNPIPLLNRASRKAYKLLKAVKQDFYLAAVGLRSDGTIVDTSNKAARNMSPAGTTPPKLPSTHAEVRLCRKLDYGAVVFVARVTKDGKWASAKPCDNCTRALRFRNVKQVYYTIGPDEYGVIDLRND